uniref:Ribonuclease H-like domain-containing protein n=1 Tax=Tanacetum cinerariifolium TaxID=118510 RepID=A0A6L2KI81_TANCI|nr:ribonuclease H-like domain-containing protein [Tanacetum cinerariifolium]
MNPLKTRTFETHQYNAGHIIGNQNGYNVVQNVRNQVGHNAVQNPSIQNVGNQNGLIVIPGIANPNGNGNLEATQAEGNSNGNNGIQLQAKEFNLMAAAGDIDKIEEVNANCILIANLHQASTSATQTNKASIYDSDGSAKIEWLQAQLGDLKGKSMDTQCALDTLDHSSHKLEDENVHFKLGIYHQRIKVVKNDKVIAPRMFKINPSKTSSKYKYVPINQASASVRTKPITLSQPHVITKKDINSDSNGLSSIGVDNTAKTRRPQPRSITKNAKVLHASKSSCIKNKEVKLEEHDRNLLLSKNQKRMSSECNNVKLAIWNDKSKVVCAMCKQFLITANYDVCVLNYVNDINSHDDNQSANVSKVAYQKTHKPKVKKSKKLGSNERLTLSKPRKPRTCLRNLKGVDLLKENRKTNLCTINLHEMASVSPICLMAHVTSTKSWLWHQRLSHLNFDTINDLAKNNLVTGLPKFKYHKEHLCPSYEQGKSKKASHPPKPVPNSKQRLHLLHMDLCGPIRVESINSRIRKIIETMNVTFDDILAMDFEQRSSKPGLQGMTSGQISFIDADHPSHVFKLKKALYGLKQAPRAWYDELSKFLPQNHFNKGTIDPTLFIRRFNDDILVTGHCSCYLFMCSIPGLANWEAPQGVNGLFNTIPIYCDLKSTIAISCNLVQHSRTKHITVCYYFIKEQVEKGTIKLYFVKTDYQLADIFTKALPVDTFNYLARRLDMEDDVDISTLIIKQYLALIRDDIIPGVVKLEIGNNVKFEISINFMRELRRKLFVGTDDEDAHEHVQRVLDIVDLFHFPGVIHDAVMLRVFPITLNGRALRWKKGLPAGVINTWDLLEKEFIWQYCPPFRTTKKLEEIRNFKQEINETLYHAWERYNDLLQRCLHHDLKSQQKVHIFYTGLDISTRRMLDSRGFITLMTPTQALISIQVMADHSPNWYDETTTKEKNNNNPDNVDVIQSFKEAHLTKEYPHKKRIRQLSRVSIRDP